MIDPATIAALTVVAAVAGFVDAIAGGGGILVMPALLWAGVPPIVAIGTNKLQSVFGTSLALGNYWRSGLVDWRGAWPLAMLAFIGALLGALTIQAVDPHLLPLIVPLFLVATAVYVLLSPRMSDEDAHHRLGPRGYAPVASAIGFYDGFFGPGAGSFYTTSLVGLRGYGLTRATAMAKFLNLSSAAASLLMFALGGHIFWFLGLCMAAGAMIGGWMGSHSALRFGAALIRPLLVITSLALTAKLIADYFSA